MTDNPATESGEQPIETHTRTPSDDADEDAAEEPIAINTRVE